MRVVPIPLDKLIPDPTQPRTAMAEGELEALVESLRERGQLLPLRVKSPDAAGNYTVISGHRRVAALRKLGATTAACVIVDEPLSEADTLAEQLAENLLREDLSPIDEAEGYHRYLSLRRITAAQAAGELHVDPARISRALALLDLPDELRALVHAGRLAKETGYYLSKLPAGDQRQRLFAEAAAGKLSRDEAARAVKTTRPKAAGAESPSVSRVCCKLGGGRSVTVCATAVRLDTLIDTLEEVLKEARKARQQGWDVSTLAKVCRDKAAGGAA